MKKQEKATKLKVKPKAYSVFLDVSGKKVKLKGDTIFEALDQIKPAIVKSKAVIVVRKGKAKTKEIILYPHQLKRLAVSKTMKLIMEKRLNDLLI